MILMGWAEVCACLSIYSCAGNTSKMHHVMISGIHLSALPTSVMSLASLLALDMELAAGCICQLIALEQISKQKACLKLGPLKYS